MSKKNNYDTEKRSFHGTSGANTVNTTIFLAFVQPCAIDAVVTLKRNEAGPHTQEVSLNQTLWA